MISFVPEDEYLASIVYPIWIKNSYNRHKQKEESKK